MPEMPRYKSHKIVNAIEVKTVDQRQRGTVVKFVEPGFDDDYPSADALMRYKPRPGDFLVVYADGYQSFSPRKAFVEGYTRE